MRASGFNPRARCATEPAQRTRGARCPDPERTESTRLHRQPRGPPLSPRTAAQSTAHETLTSAFPGLTALSKSSAASGDPMTFKLRHASALVHAPLHGRYRIPSEASQEPESSRLPPLAVDQTPMISRYTSRIAPRATAKTRNREALGSAF